MRSMLLALVLSLAPLAAHAEAWRCTNAAGGTIYQARPCAEGTPGRATDIDTEPEPDKLFVPPAAPLPSLGNGPPRDEHGRIIRNQKAKAYFKATHPCPATGATYGPCPGYVIDHVQALACGGVDMPGNMQWQTEAEGHAKDSWERKGCEIGSGATARTGIVPRYPAANAPSYGSYPSGTYIGPRGGRYHFSGAGKKVYEKRR